MNKKREPNPLIVIGVILIAIIVWFAISYFQKPKLTTEVKIGDTVALSGSAAALGEDSRNGVELAVEELKAKGTYLSIIFEDDQYDPQKTVTAYHKLIDVDKVKYIITFGTGNSNAVAPLAQNDKVVQIAIATDPKILDYKFSIKEGSEPEEYGRALAKEVIKRDYKRIFILGSNHEGVLAFVNKLKEQEDIPWRIIGQKNIDPNETDFRTFLTQAKASNPDSLMLEIVPGKVGLVSKQARELGLDVPLFAAGVFEDQSAINSAAGTLEGQWFVNPDVTESFVEKYKARFGKIPGREASNGYDAIMMFAQALNKVGDDPVKVNDYLHKLKSFDSTSARGGMRVENGNFIKTAIVKIVKGNTFIPYYQ